MDVRYLGFEIPDACGRLRPGLRRALPEPDRRSGTLASARFLNSSRIARSLCRGSRRPTRQRCSASRRRDRALRARRARQTARFRAGCPRIAAATETGYGTSNSAVPLRDGGRDGGGLDGGCRSRLSCTRSGRRACSYRRTPSDIPRRRRLRGGRAGRTGTRRGRERSAGPAPIRPGPRPASSPGRPAPPVGCARRHRRSGAPVRAASGVGTSTRWRPIALRHRRTGSASRTSPNPGRAGQRRSIRRR